MGNKGRTEGGDVQVMSAAAGVRHAEYNREDVATTLFQIWIEPNVHGGEPSWGAAKFPKDARDGRWSVLASGFGEPEALPIRADARVLGATIAAGASLVHEVGARRHAYLVPATGSLDVDGVEVTARDGVALSEGRYVLTAREEAEVVLVDAA